MEPLKIVGHGQLEDWLMYERGVDFARRAHRGQVRKVTGEPYVEHPIRVARILAGAGEDIDTMTAGLLHDVLEDTEIGAAQIQTHFGGKICGWVQECTEPSKEDHPQANWRARKDVMINRARNVPREVAAVMCADKADNLASTVPIACERGIEGAWKALKTSRKSQLWYHQQMVQALEPYALPHWSLYKEGFETLFQVGWRD